MIVIMYHWPVGQKNAVTASKLQGEVFMKTTIELNKDEAPVELSEKELAEVGGGRRVILY
jgi:hypothetical protein